MQIRPRGLYLPRGFCDSGKRFARRDGKLSKHFFGQAHNISKYAEGLWYDFPEKRL